MEIAEHEYSYDFQKPKKTYSDAGHSWASHRRFSTSNGDIIWNAGRSVRDFLAKVIFNLFGWFSISYLHPPYDLLLRGIIRTYA
jgi:hypothetical protein